MVHSQCRELNRLHISLQMAGVLKHAPHTPCPPTGYEGMPHMAVTVLLFILSTASFCFHVAKLSPAESVLFPLHIKVYVRKGVQVCFLNHNYWHSRGTNCLHTAISAHECIGISISTPYAAFIHQKNKISALSKHYYKQGIPNREKSKMLAV